jgi:hypothetical protein
MIFSLGRFGIVPMEEMKRLDKRWAAHRKLHGLDLKGKEPHAVKIEVTGCEHSNSRG